MEMEWAYLVEVKGWKSKKIDKASKKGENEK